MISLSRSRERSARRFRPRLWPTLAALCGIAVLLGLGTWQVQRLHWKEGLIAAREAKLALPPAALPAEAADWRAFDFRRVGIEGTFRHDLEQRFGFMAHQGRPGHHLLTPLVRADGTAVLVDRGWVPSDEAGPVRRPEGPLEVIGIARFRADDAPSWPTPENHPQSRLWYWYDLPALERAVGLDLAPVVVEAGPGVGPDVPPIGGQTRTELPNNHLQYALTWYALALALLAVYVAFSIERRER